MKSREDERLVSTFRMRALEKAGGLAVPESEILAFITRLRVRGDPDVSADFHEFENSQSGVETAEREPGGIGGAELRKTENESATDTDLMQSIIRSVKGHSSGGGRPATESLVVEPVYWPNPACHPAGCGTRKIPGPRRAPRPRR